MLQIILELEIIEADPVLLKKGHHFFVGLGLKLFTGIQKVPAKVACHAQVIYTNGV